MIGIIAHSVYKLTTRTIGRDGVLWGISLVTAAVIGVMVYTIMHR